LILPMIFVLTASLLHLYPFAGRLLLFLMPATIILISIACGKILESKNQYLAILGPIIIIWLFTPIFLNAQYSFFVPKTVEDVRPLVKYYQAKRQKDDIIYLYYGAQGQFRYYSKFLKIENDHPIFGIERIENLNKYLADIDKLKGYKRVWFLFSHTISINGINEEKFYLKILNNNGRLIDSRFAEGASIYLYDLSNK
jgi:hypothetical protein